MSEVWDQLREEGRLPLPRQFDGRPRTHVERANYVRANFHATLDTLMENPQPSRSYQTEDEQSLLRKEAAEWATILMGLER